MAKGYIVADIHVREKEGFEKFREMALPVLKEYGAKILVRNPNAESREGKKSGVVVVFEFESMDQARKFYESEGNNILSCNMSIAAQCYNISKQTGKIYDLNFCKTNYIYLMIESNYKLPKCCS